MIYLIEHGETPLDAKGESHGGRDAPLSRKGRQQAIALGLRLRKLEQPPEMIYHSGKKRAMQTAKLAGHVARIPVQEAAALNPLRAGALGAGPEAEVAERLRPYFDNPGQTIPGGEAVGPWRQRHLRFLRRVGAGGKPVALVTHSNVVGSALGGAEGARRAMASPPRPAVAIAVEFGKRAGAGSGSGKP